MKFNIADPRTGAQKQIEIDDDKRCACFFDRKMGQEVEADTMGDEFKGYIFKIMGGNDKQGFPMKQGILVKGRVRLLLSKGHSTYKPDRTGERKRKSVRGCIVGQDIRALSLAMVKEGEKPIEGLCDRQLPRRLGPKRVTRIRRLFALEETKKDDKNGALIKKNVIRRTWTAPNGKSRQKAPKIQRISTPERRRRRRLLKLSKKANWKAGIKANNEYQNLLTEVAKQKKAAAAARKQSRTSSAELKQKKEEETKKAQQTKKESPKKGDKKVAAKKDDKKAPQKVDKKADTKKDDKKKAKK